MGLWHEIKIRLGLADEFEDEYDDEEYYSDDSDEEEDAYPARRTYRNPYGGPAASNPGVRRVTREPDIQRARDAAPLRAVPSHDRQDSRDGGRPQEAAQVKMHIIEPRSFSEAQGIADKFKQGTPVIMNLTLTDADLSKRLIDFASGLTYGLSGGLQKVSEKVFMLTPANVDVAAEDRRRLRDKGLFTVE